MSQFTLIAILGIASVFALAAEGYEYEHWNNRPREEFSQGAQMFQKAKDILKKEYYKDGITDDELYRAAVAGMVEHLDPKMKEWNHLLSPTELSEMKTDVSGEIVGSGLEISLHDSLVDILATIPASPAEKAGIRAGDKLLAINGALCNGKQLRDIVYQIRGKVGETRKLTLLRDDKVLTKTLRLDVIPYANVTSETLPGNVGLIGIRYFSETTSRSLKSALEKARDRRVGGLIIDLRGNGGGLFNSAVESAGYLLRKGKTIVSVSKRGIADEKILAQGEQLIKGIPLIVLVNEATHCGAEVVAAALRESAGAKLVGNRTHGKWSVQKIEELGNSFALHFTTGLLTSPSGQSFNGTGVEPDIAVSMEANDKIPRPTNTEERLGADIQLRTALNLLRAS